MVRADKSRWTIALGALFGALACDSAPDSSVVLDAGAELSHAEEMPDLISDAMDVAKNRPGLCARAADDAVQDVFCADQPAQIRSLQDLQTSLHFSYEQDPVASAAGDYGDASRSYAVFLGHSTALSGRLVSSINPRSIQMNFTSFITFTRGVQQVELATQDRASQHFNFYLLRFEQACNVAAGGCKPGDLFTPQIEADWQRVSLQDAEDLENTPSDCRQCHQRGSDTPLLLMRELRGPWTHFFGSVDENALPFPEAVGGDLSRDYLRAKGLEAYAGVPAEVLGSTAGLTLQNTVFQTQPLLFDGDAILNERWPWSPDGYLSTPSPSPTWQASFEAFKRGEQLALPYHGGRATDLDKQTKLADSYQGYLRHELDPADLPDLAQIFPDDPQTRAEIGLQNEPGAPPAQLLVQVCGSCHNDVLDQSISRARFNIALARLGPAELDNAIARLRLPRGSALAMPPKEGRQLDSDALKQLIAYLQQRTRPSADDALLEHAAQRGMAGPQQGLGMATQEKY
jgi:mono/diheme cytochrome c family protein